MPNWAISFDFCIPLTLIVMMVPTVCFARVWFSKPEIESKLWFNDVGDAACGDTLQLETTVANVPNAK